MAIIGSGVVPFLSKPAKEGKPPRQTRMKKKFISLAGYYGFDWSCVKPFFFSLPSSFLFFSLLCLCCGSASFSFRLLIFHIAQKHTHNLYGQTGSILALGNEYLTKELCRSSVFFKKYDKTKERRNANEVSACMCVNDGTICNNS